jgi:hypothetical protein
VSHYVLLHPDDEPSADDLARIEQTPGVNILDHSIDRAILLEAPEEAVAELRANLKDWIVAKQTIYPPPSPATETIAEPDS